MLPLGLEAFSTAFLQALLAGKYILEYFYLKMILRAFGPLASRLRQRKYQLLRRFRVPEGALPGSLGLTYVRCGRSTCHCASDRGHAAWSLTYMVQGKKRMQHIPKKRVEEVRRRVQVGREFQDAVREILTANVQLFVLAQKQRKKTQRKRR